MENDRIKDAIKMIRASGVADNHTKLIENSALIRLGKFDRVDTSWIENQVLAMSKRENRAVESSMEELLLHLLKWKYQPERRGTSWEKSIRKQRNSLSDGLGRKTILNHLTSRVENCYRLARDKAAAETNLKLSNFPSSCEWTFEQIMDEEFFPND